MADRERSPTLWTRDQVAEHLGIKPDSVRQWARRKGIHIAERRVENGIVRSYYQAADIYHHTTVGPPAHPGQ